MKPGDKVESYSSVGMQIVTIVETGLKVQNPIPGSKYFGTWTDNMVIVLYDNGGKGMAHVNQLRRIGIEADEAKPNIGRAGG